MLRAGAESSAGGRLLRQMNTDRIYNVLCLVHGQLGAKHPRPLSEIGKTGTATESA